MVTDTYYGSAGKRMAESVLEEHRETVNHKAKDSVFIDLFGKPEYLIQLYRVLHPEDTVSQMEDLTIVTLENLLLREKYNDLGFMVGNRLMILVEAQSTWSVNIVVRFLLYIADTYSRYIEHNNINLFNSKRAELPVPELYVVYTGNRKNCPEIISLRDDIFRSAGSDIEVRAKVLRSSIPGDILDQYITFTKILDMQIKAAGSTRKAVEETLRICRDEDILREYLRNEEVADIMYTFIDKEKQMKLMLEELREETIAEGMEIGRAKGRKEGREEGREEGRKEGRKEGRAEGRDAKAAEIADKLITELGYTAEDACVFAGISVEDYIAYKNSSRES